ncbi:MAG: AAA family ATPase [Beijerinckiaceae bacterium]
MMQTARHMHESGNIDHDTTQSHETIAPLPRISIQAFCEHADTAEVIDSIRQDRRTVRAQIKTQMGGTQAALEAYRTAPTPNVIILEAIRPGAALIADLEQLANVCDDTTRVIVIGEWNDITLYRDLVSRGISEYMVSPIAPLNIIKTLSGLYTESVGATVGRVISVIGARGGVGSSTIAHNLAWGLSTTQQMQTALVDLDLGFGTAGLSFDQDPVSGIAEAIFAPDRLDANLLDRLLTKCSENLSLLAAPALLERSYDFDESAFDGIIDLLRASTPCIVLDTPHVWSAWTKRISAMADEIIIVAEPDLASFRNVKNLVTVLKQLRSNDRPPRLVLNKIGVPKRPELPIADFAKILEIEPEAKIPFDAAMFGAALNNGRMIMEMQGSSKIAEMFSLMSASVLGRHQISTAKSNPLHQLMAKLKKSQK